MSINNKCYFFNTHLNARLFIENKNDITDFCSIRECKDIGASLDVKNVWRQMLEICVFLKSNGVVHLNINPDNVWVNLECGDVKFLCYDKSELTFYRKMNNDVGTNRVSRIAAEKTLDTLFGQQLSKTMEVVRCSNYVNHFPYVDPVIDCAKILNIEEYIFIDDKFDVFSSGMTLLSYMIDDSLWSNSRNILCLLKNIRGPLDPREVWLFGNALKNASIAKGRDLRKNDQYTGILCAMKDSISGGNIVTNVEKKITAKYDVGLMKSLLSSIHPVPAYRPNSEELLYNYSSVYTSDIENTTG